MAWFKNKQEKYKKKRKKICSPNKQNCQAISMIQHFLINPVNIIAYHDKQERKADDFVESQRNALNQTKANSTLNLLFRWNGSRVNELKQIRSFRSIWLAIFPFIIRLCLFVYIINAFCCEDFTANGFVHAYVNDVLGRSGHNRNLDHPTKWKICHFTSCIFEYGF